MQGSAPRPLVLDAESSTRVSPTPIDIPYPAKPLKAADRKRPLPANPSRLSFVPKESQYYREQSPKRSKTGANHHERDYHPFMELDQAGWSLVGSNTSDCLVTIKRRKIDSNDRVLPSMQTLCHENIVSLMDLYWEDGYIISIYEKMDVSLYDLNTVKGIRDCWKPWEIGGICSKVWPNSKIVGRDED